MASAAGVAATALTARNAELEASQWPLRPVSLRPEPIPPIPDEHRLNGLCGRCRCDRLSDECKPFVTKSQWPLRPVSLRPAR